MDRDDVLFAVHDRQGRPVLLTRDRWEHLASDHPEIAGLIPELMRAVREPTEVLAGPRPGEEWFYLEGAGPSRWLKVVVQFGGRQSGRILTAFPRRAKP